MGMLVLLLSLFVISQEKKDVYIIDISSPRYKAVRLCFFPKDEASAELSNIVIRNLGVIGYFEVGRDDCELSVEIERSQKGFAFSGRFSDKNLFKVEMRGEKKRAVADAFSNYVIQKVVGLDTDIFGRRLFILSNLDGKKEIYRAEFLSDKFEKVVSAKSFIPSFSVSPSGNRIAYVHFDGKSYRLYVADLVSQRVFSPVIREGMFISPHFVSEETVMLALNFGSGSNIYLFDMVRRSLNKITTGNADISARPMPNGNRVVVVSGRAGLPQIYIRDIGGGEERLPLSGRYNTSPDVSPDGRMMVFSKLEGSRLNIYVFDFEKRVEKPIVVDFGSSENPVWSPDGNFIFFSSNKDGDYDIYITDRFGNFIRKVFDTAKDEFIAIPR